MSNGTFSKVEATDERMYGPRGLIACGYPPEEHAPLTQFLEQVLGMETAVCFASEQIQEQTLKEIFALPHGTGTGTPSNLTRAMVISGCTQRELHTLMSGYRQAGLPPQLWATLTPISENWSLNALLAELVKESEAMNRKK